MARVPFQEGARNLSAVPKDERPKVSQTDGAYLRLKAMITSGEIDPGDQIDATRLVDVLEFGRTPIREALLRLQTEGIVKIVPKRGVQIVKLSADDLTEIYQVISAVEIEAVRLLTMQRPSADQLGKLYDAAERMLSDAEADRREAWIMSDEAFHRGLLELNPNRRLGDVGLLHRDLAQRAHFVAIRMLQPVCLIESARNHRKLIDLMVDGDVDKAVADHQTQRQRGAKMLVDVLRQYRLSQL
jgi:DNA-binding GntR family transcriptional regulator